MKAQFFIEGFDVKFIRDYIDYLELPIDNLICNSTEGWTNLPNVAQKFREATNKEVKNIIIFDADANYEQRRQEIITQGEQLGIEFELFLFPNNQDSGCFENLLVSIVHPEKGFVITCFDEYCSCISANGYNFSMPIKSKIFAYLEATNQPPKIKDVNFQDSNCWNLNHELLSPLRNFLSNQII